MARASAGAFVLLSLAASPCWPFASGASFLEMPVGGRPLSLGGAYTALASDAYAPVWNPAGLGNLDGSQIASMHVAFVESMSYDFVGFAHPIKDGRQGFGASVQYFSPGSIAGTDAAGNDTGDFSGSFEAYSLGYGLQVSKKASVGAAAKLIHAQMGEVSAQSYAADVGGACRFGEFLTVGVAAANLGTPIRFIEEKEPLPSAVRFGAAYRAAPMVTLAAEGVHSNGEASGARLGMEWRALDWTAVRAGYRLQSGGGPGGVSGFSVGLGIYFWDQQFDYAWLPLGDLGNAQYFSLVIKLERFLNDAE